jgi:hypothetical protein
MLVTMLVICGLTLIMLMIQFNSYGYYPKKVICTNTSLIEKLAKLLQTLFVEDIDAKSKVL